jgi:hypothetical protein
MERLAESASGLRHLRWAREILGTLEVHYEHDARLATAERDLVLAQAVELRLYPALAAGGTVVADGPDEDDDATG